MRNLSTLINKVSIPILRKKGFYDSRIITSWHEIVGHEWAKYTIPVKISSDQHNNCRTLHIIAYNSGVAFEMQYAHDIIIERLAQIFGYKTIKRIKIQQHIE